MPARMETLEYRRLLAAYVLDRAFSGDGLLETADAQIGDAPPTQMLTDSKGRLVLVHLVNQVSTGNAQLFVRRYTAAGAADASFDGDGKLAIDLGGFRRPTPLVAMMADNGLVIALRQSNRPLLQRYTDRGRYDAAFVANVGTNYKGLTVAGGVHEHLSVDRSGRVVWTQSRESLFAGQEVTPINASDEVYVARLQRFDADGTPDASFGVRGGLDVSLPVGSPLSYTITSPTIAGRTFNRRGDMTFSPPRVDDAGNISFVGSRGYARGFGAGTGEDVLNFVTLPFAFTLDPHGEVVRSLVADLEPDKSRFVDSRLVYSGVAARLNQLELDAAGNVYASVIDVQLRTANPTADAGLVVFQPEGNTFDVAGFDPDFPIGRFQRVGDRVWATNAPRPQYETHRLVELNPDATDDKTLGVGRFEMPPPVAFAGLNARRPSRIFEFQDDEQVVVRAVKLTEQSGSAGLDDGTLRITGTAGDDTIVVTRRGDGRVVVTGAGATRSFPRSAVQRLSIDAGGGDDLVLVPDFIGNGRATINGSGGDDEISSRPGRQVLIGGSGNDLLVGDYSADTIRGEAGDDTIGGLAGADLVFGGTGDDAAVMFTGATYDGVERSIPPF